MVSVGTRGNYQKHQNPNPVQQWLISRFHAKICRLVSRFASNNLLSCLVEDSTSGNSQGHSDFSLLDVGCGEGYVLSYLKGRLPAIALAGVDNEEEAIVVARKNLPGLNLTCADAYQLPFTDDSFDATICLEVLEHLREPERALSELIRVSHQSVILSVPNQPFFALANFLRGKNISRFGEDAEHVQHWTGRGFLSFLNGKITIVEVDYSFPWIIVAADASGHKKTKVSH